MKMFIVLLAVGMLSGCGRFERVYTHWTGDLTYKCSKHGVQYVQSDSGLAISVDATGRPIQCDDE